MNRDADNLADVQWVAQCTRKLRERWPHLDVTSVEETALELWRDETLKGMNAEQAVELWLWPLRRPAKPPDL